MAYGRVNAPSGDFFAGDMVQPKELVPVFDYKYHVPDWSLFPNIESGNEESFRHITTSDSFCYVYNYDWGMWQLDKQSGKLLKELDISWGAKTRATDKYIVRLSGSTITVFDSVTESQVTTISNIENFDITNTHMFYIQGNKVYSSRFNGVQKELIYSGSNPTLVSVCDDDIYIKDGNTIYLYSISNGTQQRQKTFSKTITSISAFNNGVYFVEDAATNVVYQLDKNLNIQWSKKTSGEKILELDSNNNCVVARTRRNPAFFFNNNGEEITTESWLFNVPEGVAVDDTHIYISGSIVWSRNYRTKAYAERRQPGKFMGCELKDID